MGHSQAQRLPAAAAELFTVALIPASILPGQNPSSFRLPDLHIV